LLAVRTSEFDRLTLVQAGCGGTGSLLARSTAATAAALRQRGVRVDLVFVDPDTVEERNIGRQLFARSDISRPKAEVVADRYAAAWGLEVSADVSEFAAGRYLAHQGLTVVVGAVDNAAARREIAGLLARNPTAPALPRVWWLDAGNSADSGQVLLGTETAPFDLEGSVSLGSVWRLPAPSLVAPDLLVPRPEETSPDRLSCAELAAANLQSQTVNSWSATIAGDMLHRLLVTRELARFATYFDARTATVASEPTSVQAIARAARLDAGARERRKK